MRRLLEATLVAALSVVLAAWELGLWRADLALPLRYAPVDDTKFYLMLVKGIVEHGSYLANSSLGWPFGQHLADYPQGADNLNLLIIRILAVFSSNAALIVNVFFLLTFALTALTAHLVLRDQGVGAPAAAVAAVLFSLLPYHFLRGESHLLLSAYYSIPLAAHLFLRVLAQRPLFARARARARPARGSHRGAAWVSRNSVATVAVCVAIGSDNLYYATFAAVLLAGAAVISSALRRWSSAVGATLALALIAVTVAVNLAPTLVYRAEHGANPTLERSAAADEASNEGLSLRLTNLLLPAPSGRIAPLARLGARYDNLISPGYCEGCYASPGSVGTIGLLWLALAALGTLAGAGSWYGLRRELRHASVGVAIAFAVGTVGGISSLIEFYLTPDIRGWNRISLVIAFFSLFAVALALDLLGARLRARRGGRAWTALALVSVLAFGGYEQSSPSSAPDYAIGYREYRSDGAFVTEIQDRLPRGAAVFQLPYVPFPEGYPDTPCCGAVPTYATKYEPLRGYLHSTTLRWSYGAVKGRAADWPAQLAGRPLSLLLPSIAAAGFDGLWFDPAGFTAAKATAVEAALRSLLRQDPLLSPDRDLWFFDLRRYALGLRESHSPALLREFTLHPLRAACAPGGVAVFNPSRSARAATLTASTAAGDVRRRATLAPGRTFVPIPSGGRILYATVTDDALASFEPTGGGRVVVGLTGPGCPG